MDTKQYNKSQCGVSIVELAIIMVIIGSLVASLIVGITFIQSAKSRAVAKQITELSVVISAFKLKYNALPGDMANATSHWGLHSAGGQTANGNGDGRIIQCDTPLQEQHRLFEHLSLSGLYSGNYDMDTGVSDAIGVVYPRYAMRDSAGIRVYTDTLSSGQWAWKVGRLVASINAPADDCLNGASRFSSSELFELDSKIDDGRPASGRVTAYGVHTQCQNGVAVPATYLHNNTGLDCELNFIPEMH
jgi:hypothetical protein